MNWEDFLRASSDYKQNRTIVRQYFPQLGVILPTFRLLIWSEMIPIHHKDQGFGIEALLNSLQMKVRRQKVNEVYQYLYNNFKYQLNQLESEPHTEGDDQDVQLLKQKFMNVCYYLVETFYGEGTMVKRFLMTELQQNDKYKQALIEAYMTELLEGFFFDLQGTQKQTPSIVIQILDNFFLFGLEFICLLIKAIIQEFEIIFERQAKEMEEASRKQNKPLQSLIQSQVDQIVAEVYHLQIEDSNIILRNIQSVQSVIFQNSKKVHSNSKSKLNNNTNSNSQLKYSPSKAVVKSSRQIPTQPSLHKKQDDLESTGCFKDPKESKSQNNKTFASPSKQPLSRVASRRNSQHTAPDYQTPNKLKVTPEPRSPIIQLQTAQPLQPSTTNKSEDFNTDMMRMIGKYGASKIEAYFCKSKNKEIAQLRTQILELQKKSIDIGRNCQELLSAMDRLNDKEN